MQEAYIETSVINRACVQSITGKDINIHLQEMGFLPAIGIQTIYELAKTFLDPNQTKQGRSLFLLLRDLDPAIIPPTEELHNREIIALRTGASVLPFLDTLNQAGTRYEIEKFANGIFDSKAEKSIRSREEKIRNMEPVMTQNYLNHISQVKADYPELSKKMRTFEDIVSYFRDDIPNLIKRILKIRITNFEAAELSQRLDSFPALRSAVLANLYLCFICIVHEASPSYDKPDDYRHIIDSSYSKAIVTGDEGLNKAVNRINPNLDVIPWKDIHLKFLENEKI